MNEFVSFDYKDPKTGKLIKAGGKADRNGFFFVNDRTNGKLLNAFPFVKKITWATGFNLETGRPNYIEEGRPGDQRVVHVLGERRVREHVDAGIDREPGHPGALDVGDDRKSAIVGRRDHGVERARVEDRSGVGVQGDLDDGCPERPLLADRRLHGVGQGGASVTRDGGELSHRIGRRPRPVGGVPTWCSEEGAREVHLGQPVALPARRDEVERRSQVDDARDGGVGERVGADEHEMHVMVDERRQRGARLAGMLAVQ